MSKSNCKIISALKDKKIFYLIIFFVAIFLMLRHNYLQNNAFYIATPDGNLYFSIAENFIKTGHFIQTSRPHEINMIVPPGLPFIYTLILGLTRNVYGIIIVQYILYGVIAVLIANTGFNISKSKLSFIILPVLFFWATKHLQVPNPSMLLTEIWATFFMVLSVFIFFLPNFPINKKIVLINVVLFVLYLVRPALLVLLVVGIVSMLVFSIKKRIKAKTLIIYLLGVIIVLTLNTLINYRETGEIVLIENYSGQSTYLANNSNTKTKTYYSSVADDFADEYFFEVYNDQSLSSHEKNEMFSNAAKKFMFENPIFVFKNAITKYYQYFILNWNVNFYIYFIAIGLFLWRKVLTKMQGILLIVAFFSVTMVPALGLYIFRYALPCLPFYVIINGSLYSFILSKFYNYIMKGQLSK